MSMANTESPCLSKGVHMETFSEDSLRRGHRLAVLIGWAMILSVLAYAGVVEFLSRSNAPFAGYSPLPADVFNTLRLVLLGVCLIDFAIIPFLRRRVLSARNQPGRPPVGNLPAPVARLLSASVTSFALCESIAIYGFVLFLLNAARQEFYLFFCLSLLAFVIHFPRHERWQEWAQNMGNTIRSEFK